jgi:hypothetical protein
MHPYPFTVMIARSQYETLNQVSTGDSVRDPWTSLSPQPNRIGLPAWIRVAATGLLSRFRLCGRQQRWTSSNKRGAIS